jgi:hypothetical protein
MKKLLFSGFFLLAGIFAVSAQNLPSISIINNTGYDIYYLYVSSSEDDNWGKDILGKDVLEDGMTFTYRLPQPLSRVSLYDFMAEDEDGDSYVKMEVSVSNNARIVFTLEDIDFDD